MNHKAIIPAVFGALAAAGAMAAIALAHTGSGSVSCTNAHFTYSGFSGGTTTIHETVTVDGVVAAQKDFVLAATSGSDDIALSLAGAHGVQESATWTGADTGSFTGVVTQVDCQTVTVTTTVPTTVTSPGPPGPATTVTQPAKTQTVTTTETVTTTVTTPSKTRTVIVRKKCKPSCPIGYSRIHGVCKKGGKG